MFPPILPTLETALRRPRVIPISSIILRLYWQEHHKAITVNGKGQVWVLLILAKITLPTSFNILEQTTKARLWIMW